VIYVSYANNGQYFLSSLEVTNDLDLIGRIVASSDEVAKAYVVENPNLTDAQMLTLVNDEDIVVRQELAKVAHLSTEALYELHRDKSEIVRVHALLNPVTDYADFMTAVLSWNFSVASKKLVCSNFRAVGHIEVFESLWNTVKVAPSILINTLNFAVRDVPPFSRF
jgi:hypothetical protein